METFVGDLLPELNKSGVESVALAHAHSRESASVGQSDVNGVVVVRVPTWGRLLYAPISPAFPLWMERIVRQFKPDIIHCHMPNTSALWALALPAARLIPWVVHWHSDVVASKVDKRLALAYPLYRPFETALLARARAIIVTSPPYLEASQALQPWRNKCHIIPLGLDPHHLRVGGDEQRRLANDLWGAASFKILCVGRLTYYKGHEILIRAMSHVAGARVILVGDGERREKLNALIESLGLAEKVILAGYKTEQEIAALRESCDVFCLPSIERTEAFGMVLLEAMSAGKSVVASKVPGSGMGWVVDEGKTGLLVPPADVDALACALRQLQSDGVMRSRMAKAAKARFDGEFQMSQVGNDIIQLYGSILEKPRQP